MSTPALNQLTLDTLNNYGRAAGQAITAYRVGSQRLAAVVDGAWAQSVVPRISKLAPVAGERLDEARGRVHAFVDKGIVQIAERGEALVERSRSLAVEQVEKFTRYAAKARPPVLASGLSTVARFSIPGAKLALAVSDKLAEGTEALVVAVEGKPLPKAVRRTAATAKRAVRKAKAPLRASMAKAAKAAEAVKKPRRVAKRATPI